MSSQTPESICSHAASRRIAIVATGISFALAVLSVVLTNKHDETRYESDAYIQPSSLISLLTRAEAACDNAESKKEKEACEVAKESLNAHAGLHDLVAQETVAKATRGLLQIGGLQSVGLYLTIIGIIWTIYYTRRMAVDAQTTALAAVASAEASEGAEAAYVFFSVLPKFVDPSARGRSKVIVELILKNYGKSPATGVSFRINLFAVDDDSVEISQLGPGPLGSEIILGPDQKAPITEFPAFDIGEYYWEHSMPRHYVIGCTYGFADKSGNVVRKPQPVYFNIFPGHVNDDPDRAVLQVERVSTEDIDRLRRENAAYLKEK